MERFVLHSREKDTLDAQAALKRLTVSGDYTTAGACQKQVAILHSLPLPVAALIMGTIPPR